MSYSGLRHDLVPNAQGRRRLGQILVDAGLLSQKDLMRALYLRRRMDVPLGRILITEGLIAQSELTDALAEQAAAPRVTLDAPFDHRFARALGARFCLRNEVMPVGVEGGRLLVATPRPDQLARLSLMPPLAGKQPLALVASRKDVHDAIGRVFGAELACDAECHTAPEFSCRHWRASTLKSALVVMLVAAIVAAFVFAPGPSFAVAIGWCAASLFAVSLMKAAGAIAAIRSTPPPKAVEPERMPRISMLVPLFREENIATSLIHRLQRLEYPKSLLDVVLVLEAKDKVTQATIARTQLPDWMRVIVVPANGPLTTKPRAMNYALDFCQGSIVGVWDAEDAPEPDQLNKVVEHFARAAPDVACLQGRLDYYNPRSNWIARCFTIEYASWFRRVIPGIARLGLVVPLGGTTLFFRRDVLEQLGRWDAHNVTEDADLGLRLARAGYRTEMVDTTTFEEANCRVWPWMKQRSRWLKGFLVTYLVHMRHPRRLLRDLGLYRFLGLQALLPLTLSQFICAPIMWSLMLIPFGLPHPVQSVMSPGWVAALSSAFVLAELINITIGISAVAAPERRHLIPWVFTLPAYFPMAVIAVYKALYEMVGQPFYWDKTTHGVTVEGKLAKVPDLSPDDPRPVSAAS